MPSRRLKVVGKTTLASPPIVTGMTPGEVDRCLYKALRAAARTHLLSRPCVPTHYIEAHLQGLGSPQQIVCGPQDEAFLRALSSKPRVTVCHIMSESEIFALGSASEVGYVVEHSLKDWTIAIRNPERVWAFKLTGSRKWQSTSPKELVSEPVGSP